MARRITTKTSLQRPSTSHRIRQIQKQIPHPTPTLPAGLAPPALPPAPPALPPAVSTTSSRRQLSTPKSPILSPLPPSPPSSPPNLPPTPSTDTEAQMAPGLGHRHRVLNLPQSRPPPVRLRILNLLQSRPQVQPRNLNPSQPPFHHLRHLTRILPQVRLPNRPVHYR